jgi:hypothetical protein
MKSALMFRVLFRHPHVVEDFSVANFIYHYTPTLYMTKAEWADDGVRVLHKLDQDGKVEKGSQGRYHLLDLPIIKP